MTSRRNVEDAVLDAARACVEAFGIRRTTLTDVARRAGVSRPTVYRRWPDATALVADLLTRELLALLDRADDTGGDGGDGDGGAEGARTARGRLTAQAEGLMREALHHPLLTRIIDHEPETMAVYAFQRLGTSQFAALDLLRSGIEDGQVDGSIRDGDAEGMARIVLLSVQSLMTSRRLTEDVLDEDALVAEARRVLDGYLAPEGGR
ncbi:helix-turn-helix domain containing protein [Nocardiopsis sp. RSe5-2]|uniref:Helix-turn-helix domain containing protein n=1 Tax=Nocardiopsis endophytica TaxID=3018445 RepID=A0ABT4U0K2_9ACTN|nr:TetR/AcrR family transcriptional regulator [Nocardiopsis endophytica]MDA2810479.1 helix-turn-helix domain containing protein [Nocardiopsis endophytica]